MCVCVCVACVQGVAGQDPRLQAALRSLPWLPETEDTHTNTTHTNNETTQQGQQASAADSTHTDTGSTGAPLGHMSEDVVLAMHLRDQCRAQLQGMCACVCLCVSYCTKAHVRMPTLLLASTSTRCIITAQCVAVC